MIKISYRDSDGDWVDHNGLITDQDTTNQKFKNARIHPASILPIVVTDVSNGVTRTIQETRWNGYYVEFYVQNNELNEVESLQSCPDIVITDLAQNIRHVVDRRSPEYFVWTAPERLGHTNTWKIAFTYRTNRTLINRATPKGATSNFLTVNAQTYYSNYDVIDINIPFEQLYEKSEGSQDILVKAIYHKGKSIVFYDTPENITQLKSDLSTFIGPSVNSLPIFRYDVIEDTSIGESLHKLLLNVYTDIDVQLPSLALTDLNTLFCSFDDGASIETETFGTPFTIFNVTEESIQDSSSNQEGFNQLDLVNSRTSKRLKFLLSRTDANNLKRLFEASQILTINGSISIIENGIAEYEDLEDGLIKLIINGLIVSDVNYPSQV